MNVTWMQTAPAFGEPERNRELLRERLPAKPGDLILLPELFTTGYLFAEREQLFRHAETVPNGPTTVLLRELAAVTGATFVAGIAERDGDALFNSVVAVSADSEPVVYRKRSQTAVDRILFRRGRGETVIEVAGRRLGLLICFDLWFSELVHDYAAAGVHGLLHLAAFGGPQTLTVARARAIETNLPVLTCNRCGRESWKGHDAPYRGRSQWIDGTGERRWRAGQEEQVETVRVEIPTDPPLLLGVPRDEETRAVRALRSIDPA
ncbi:MAG: carbon-nitrogen hydrolase family protein [Acidobacteriota bacterium]